MSFFDDLGKKVSRATQTVTQKGKELAEITKLNFSVSEEEKKIDDNYTKIGKLFVQKIGDRSEGDFLPLVNEIKASEEKISQFKAQINAIRGTATCEKCGAALADGAVFCTGCGTKIKPDEDGEAKEEAKDNEETKDQQ